MMIAALDALVRNALEKGDQLQIKLNELSQNPIGPGKVDFYRPLGEGTEPLLGVYRILTQAVMQTAAGQRQVSLPIIFTADSVLWVAEPPLNADSEPLIEIPGARSRGGLHIGS
jgi:hypothetical protein